MIILSPDLVRETPTGAPWGASIDANSPLVGYHNIVTPTNVLASSQEALNPASNLGNNTTFDRWLATSASAQTLTVATSFAGNIDYLGVARHNLGTAGGAVSVDGFSQSPNLLLQSNGFSTTWSNTNITLTPNATPSPITGYNAWQWTGTHANFDYLYQDVAKTAAPVTYTFSVYAKKLAGTHVILHANNQSGSASGGVIFDLVNAIYAIQAPTGFTNVAAGMVALANGWYRCWWTFTTDNAAVVRTFIGPSIGNYINGAGSNTSIYVFGADLTQSSSLQPYKPTTTTTSGWFALTYQSTLPDNVPAIFQYTPQIMTQIRFNIGAGSVAPYIGVMFVGKLLVMQRRLYVGHVPLNDGIDLNVVNGLADSADFLGRTILGEGRSTTANFDNLTPDWTENYLRPFIAAAKQGPFFWAWRPGDYPRDTGYAWLTAMPRIENSRRNGMRKASLQMSGLG